MNISCHYKIYNRRSSRSVINAWGRCYQSVHRLLHTTQKPRIKKNRFTVKLNFGFCVWESFAQDKLHAHFYRIIIRNVSCSYRTCYILLNSTVNACHHVKSLWVRAYTYRKLATSAGNQRSISTQVKTCNSRSQPMRVYRRFQSARTSSGWQLSTCMRPYATDVSCSYSMWVVGTRVVIVIESSSAWAACAVWVSAVRAVRSRRRATPC